MSVRARPPGRAFAPIVNSYAGQHTGPSRAEDTAVKCADRREERAGTGAHAAMFPRRDLGGVWRQLYGSRALPAGRFGLAHYRRQADLWGVIRARSRSTFPRTPFEASFRVGDNPAQNEPHFGNRTIPGTRAQRTSSLAALGPGSKFAPTRSGDGLAPPNCETGTCYEVQFTPQTSRSSVGIAKLGRLPPRPTNMIEPMSSWPIFSAMSPSAFESSIAPANARPRNRMG